MDQHNMCHSASIVYNNLCGYYTSVHVHNLSQKGATELNLLKLKSLYDNIVILKITFQSMSSYYSI